MNALLAALEPSLKLKGVVLMKLHLKPVDTARLSNNSRFDPLILIPMREFDGPLKGWKLLQVCKQIVKPELSEVEGREDTDVLRSAVLLER